VGKYCLTLFIITVLINLRSDRYELVLIHGTVVLSESFHSDDPVPPWTQQRASRCRSWSRRRNRWCSRSSSTRHPWNVPAYAPADGGGQSLVELFVREAEALQSKASLLPFGSRSLCLALGSTLGASKMRISITWIEICEPGGGDESSL
jgi:hypothetical protein